MNKKTESTEDLISRRIPPIGSPKFSRLEAVRFCSQLLFLRDNTKLSHVGLAAEMNRLGFKTAGGTEVKTHTINNQLVHGRKMRDNKDKDFLSEWKRLHREHNKAMTQDQPEPESQESLQPATTVIPVTPIMSAEFDDEEMSEVEKMKAVKCLARMADATVAMAAIREIMGVV